MSTLAALVKSVGGSKVQVSSLVPVGASVETYEPTPGDLIVLSKAQLLVENGAGLEVWLDKLVRNAGGPLLRKAVMTEGMPLASWSGVQAGRGDERTVNPHLWLDPVYAQQYVRKIAAALTRVDPSQTSYFVSNERRELARLKALDHWVRSQIATISPQNRVMICFHDAWYYFDRRYGIRDIGTVEPSPGQEPSAGYFAQLVRTAKTNHVRAVFGESQFSPKLVNQLAASAGIHTVSNLYDDTLGSSPDLSTYEQIMHYDVTTIVRALKS